MKEDAPTAVNAPPVAQDTPKAATEETAATAGETTDAKERKPRQAKLTEAHFLDALVERSGEGRSAIDIKTAKNLVKKLVKLSPNIISLLTLAGVSIPSNAGKLAALVIDNADKMGLLDAQADQSAVPA